MMAFGDELFKLVEQASAAMHCLAIHVALCGVREGQAEGAEGEMMAIRF